MKLLYTILLTLSLSNADINITPALKAKAHSMIKEIKPSKKSKLTPKEFITVAVLSTGLEKYSMSSYQSRDFSNGQAAFDEPEFYKKECFNPNKYSNMHIKYVEKKVRPLFSTSYSKHKNYKCLYYTKNAKEIEKTLDVIFNNKLHGELNTIDSIGILPVSFEELPIETLVSIQYQYEHIDIKYLEYPTKSPEFKKAYQQLWK